MKMKQGMRWQKGKDYVVGKMCSSSFRSGTPTGQLVDISVRAILKAKIIKLFLGVILLLASSLYLLILGDKISVTQVGLQLGSWPHTINPLQANELT
jgi:hypothetical protein